MTIIFIGKNDGLATCRNSNMNVCSEVEHCEYKFIAVSIQLVKMCQTLGFVTLR